MMNVKNCASWPSDRTESRLETSRKSNLAACGMYCVLNCGTLVVEARVRSGKEGGPLGKPLNYVQALGDEV
jgi:hypothetical protein